MNIIQEQLKNLEKQKEELEKRIQDENKRKQKIKRGSIHYLEQLVQPITNRLDATGHIVCVCNSSDSQHRMKFEQGEQLKKSTRKRCNEEYETTLNEFNRRKNEIQEKLKRMYNKEEIDKYAFIPPRKNIIEVEQEEIYLTLIGILKKQDERIKTLENFILKNQILNQDV